MLKTLSRVVICGQAGVGKTAFGQRLQNDKFVAALSVIQLRRRRSDRALIHRPRHELLLAAAWRAREGIACNVLHVHATLNRSLAKQVVRSRDCSVDARMNLFSGKPGSMGLLESVSLMMEQDGMRSHPPCFVRHNWATCRP